MTELVRYDAMCQAIAECHRVDEVKELRDKALALEAYARQAMNTEAERKAASVRIRAERRAGQLLKDMAKNGERATKGRPEKMSHDTTFSGLPGDATTLTSLGISRDQSSRWQKLADVPEDKFEATLADPRVKPATNTFLEKREEPEPETKASGKPGPVHNDALGVFGYITDMERIAGRATPAFLVSEMTPTMLEEIVRMVPAVAGFVGELGERANEQLQRWANGATDQENQGGD